MAEKVVLSVLIGIAVLGLIGLIALGFTGSNQIFADDEIDQVRFLFVERNLIEVFTMNENSELTLIDSFVWPDAERGPIRSSAMLDYNSDGILDLVIPDQKPTGSLLLFKGLPDGTFESDGVQRDGGYPAKLKTADFNGDGKEDLVLLNGGEGSVFGQYLRTFYNTGSGFSFGPFSIPNPNVKYFGAMETIILNPYGNEDILLASLSRDRVYSFFNIGDQFPTFPLGTNWYVGGDAQDIVSRDFNGDGNPDFVTMTNHNSDTGRCILTMAFSDGSRFVDGVSNTSFSRGCTGMISVDDLDNDGILDIIFGVQSSESVHIWNYDGTQLIEKAIIPVPFTSTYSHDVGDVNGDGILDILVGGSIGGVVLLGNGDMTFTEVEIPLSTSNLGGAYILKSIQQDVEPPTLFLPSDIILEAPADTTPSNTGTASAIDDIDHSPIISFSDVESLDIFGLGTITRTWTATDNVGNSVSDNQIITVIDSTPPEISIPEDITLGATDSFGTVVDYPVTAFDIVDPNPTIQCTFNSGSLIPIGTTTVTCTATDVSGNESFGSFDITIIITAETFDGVNVKIESLGLQKGIENSLTVKIDSAAKSFDKGNTKTLKNNLEAFINEVNALDSKKLSESDAQMLIEYVTILIDNI